MSDKVVDRSDVEKMLWRWTGWQASQRSVDAVLSTVDEYVGGLGTAPAWDPRAESAAADVLAQARREAEQIVQSARDEAAALQAGAVQSPERPPDGLKQVAASQVPLDVYRDADGVLWLRLGVDAGIPTGETERTRKCSRCGGVKPLIRFSRDKKSRAGRKVLCKDCENANRREREARKKQAVTEEVPS